MVFQEENLLDKKLSNSSAPLETVQEGLPDNSTPRSGLRTASKRTGVSILQGNDPFIRGAEE